MMAIFNKLIFVLFILVPFSCNNSQEQSKAAFSAHDIKKIKEQADLAYDKDDIANSIILFNKLIEFDSTKGEYYFKRGNSYMMTLDIKKSEKDFLKSIQLGYRISSSYYNIGLNYAGINDITAVYYFKKSLEKDSTNEKAKIKLEQSQNRLKRDK